MMEGFLRKYGCWRCGLVDVFMFSLLKEDWQRQIGNAE
jgi:RimJ/RimL family protein N-acetyltransferase